MYIGDSNTFGIWTSGIYSTSANITGEEGAPNGADRNGSLLVFNSGWYGVKVYKPSNNAYLYVLTKGGSNESVWYKFAGINV